MLPKSFILLSLYSSASLWAAAQAPGSDDLCSSLVVPYRGYNCDEMQVTTEDGFVLGMQRIFSTVHAAETRQPVFLMHGVLSGGDTWLLNPPDQSLGFILADAGYDVWIGNFRTTTFSHGHVMYTPRDKEYWDWSLDELAEKDLTSMIGFVYRTTNMLLHYVGFSQGTQAGFAALSQGMLAQWLDKLVMIAPVAYVKYLTTRLAILGARLQLDKVFSDLHVFSFNTKTSTGRQYVDILCPAANTRCFNNWATAFTVLRQGTFAKFDYGAYENGLRYNAMYPPAYALSKVPTSKMLLIHGKNDALSDVRDVFLLKEQLLPGFKTLLLPDYAHIDFIIGYNANIMVYEDVLQFLRE